MTDRIITYKFRAYPNRRQARAIAAQLAEAARLYNAALQERREAWRFGRKSITFADQSRQLPDIRRAGDIGIVSYEIASEVLHRVKDAFTGFFTRVKGGAKAGYPRFRSAARYDSIGTLHPGIGLKLAAEGLRVHGIEGWIRVRQHRAVVGAQRKLSIKRSGDRWFVIVSALFTPAPLDACDVSVGLDVGLASFIATSAGQLVDAPRLFRASEPELRRAQRHIERCRLGSRRSQKAKAHVRRIHERSARRRADFTHKLSRQIVNVNGRIAVERLNIAGLARTRMAKSIHDAGWRLFLNQLAYKAAWAGRVYVEVPAAGTSQTCLCGAAVPKTLAERWHHCSSCGLSGPRDVVSAQVIEARGRRVQTSTGPIGSVVCGAAS
jgi:putative transposase